MIQSYAERLWIKGTLFIKKKYYCMTRTCQMSNNLYDASLKVPPLKNASISLSFELSLK